MHLRSSHYQIGYRQRESFGIRLGRLSLLLLSVLVWSIPSDCVSDSHARGVVSYLSGSSPLEDCGDDGVRSWEAYHGALVHVSYVREHRFDSPAVFCGGEYRLDIVFVELDLFDAPLGFESVFIFPRRPCRAGPRIVSAC